MNLRQSCSGCYEPLVAPCGFHEPHMARGGPMGVLTFIDTSFAYIFVCTYQKNICKFSFLLLAFHRYV